MSIKAGSTLGRRQSPRSEPAAASDAVLDAVREDAARCTACPLWENATQTVFGEGPVTARIVLVGEQPGDVEDQQGHPFVGPAGRILDTALEMAEMPRDEVYVTNAVKHFKWEARGKRRIHQRPNQAEVAACSPWLDMELDILRPRVVVCLGATAAQALLGQSFRVTKQRGVLLPLPGQEFALATVHPSSLLRIPSSTDRKLALEHLAADLRTAAEAARRPESAA